MPKAYPEFSQHKELPAWGFYVRHADGVTFKNVKLTALKKDYRPAIVLDDVHNRAFTKIKVVEPSAGKKEKIHAYKSTKIKKIEREIRETHKGRECKMCISPPFFM